MAITRKNLREKLGEEVPDSIISEILNMFHAEIDTIRDERDEALKKADTITADLEKANGEKAKAEKDLTDYKAEQTAKEVRATKVSEYEKLLKEIGVSEKRFDLIKKATDMDTIELDGKGNIKNVDALKESIKTEYADFITTTSTQGATVQTPPAGGQTITKDTFDKMSYRERAELYNTQRELYDELIK